MSDPFPTPPLVPPRLATFRAADGYPFVVRIWDAASTAAQPAARIVCLHGIVSHSGWYLRSCQYLAQRGFEVHFLDRRGSGLNAAARGDVDSFRTWMCDVIDYLDALGRALPRILLGISWGGKLAAAIAKAQSVGVQASACSPPLPRLLDGLALVCPGIVAQKGARPAQRVALRLANGVGIRQRRVPIPLQDPALFTDEPAWQAYIRDDPLTLRKLTIRGAVADLELNRFVADSAPLIHVPTLLMLAGRDRILDNQGVLGWFGRLGTSDKHLSEYPEAAHTFEFEPQPAPYFRDLATWLETCCCGSRMEPS